MESLTGITEQRLSFDEERLSVTRKRQEQFSKSSQSYGLQSPDMSPDFYRSGRVNASWWWWRLFGWIAAKGMNVTV